MEDAALQRILEEVEAARNDPSTNSLPYYLGKMHALAESQYTPAIPFFIAGLSDPRWDWRSDCLRALGFHYEFSPESEITAQIRQILLSDPTANVRMTAAAVLGGRSKWPDKDLIHALQNDADPFVRSAAFEAALDLAGVPFPIMRQEIERLTKEKIQPTLDQLKKIISANGLDPIIP
jgi:HEAT repeat protein